MQRDNWTVGDHAIRPAGEPDKCFYCKQPVGEQHANGCVIRKRTVVVKTIVTHVIDIPEHWHKGIIEFTEGSACSDNMVAELVNLVNRLDDVGSCTCGLIEREFVCEATEEDEDNSALYVNKLLS